MASYVYGNTARKENTAPLHQQERQPKAVNPRVKKNQRNALHMNRGYVVFLAVAAMVALFACVQYLQLQSEVTTRSKNVTSLQRQLENKKEANTTKYNVIMDSINLEKVRDRAMNDLGMVYATEGQIITYEDPTSNSVVQYSSIPESGIIASADVVE